MQLQGTPSQRCPSAESTLVRNLNAWWLPAWNPGISSAQVLPGTPESRTRAGRGPREGIGGACIHWRGTQTGRSTFQPELSPPNSCTSGMTPSRRPRRAQSVEDRQRPNAPALQPLRIDEVFGATGGKEGVPDYHPEPVRFLGVSSRRYSPLLNPIRTDCSDNTLTGRGTRCFRGCT
jgi:hypothetical protein